MYSALHSVTFTGGVCLTDCEVGSNMRTKVGNSLSSLVDKQDIRCLSAEPSRTMSHQFNLLPLCSKSGLCEKLPPGGIVNVSLTRWVWSQTSRCSVWWAGVCGVPVARGGFGAADPLFPQPPVAAVSWQLLGNKCLNEIINGSCQTSTVSSIRAARSPPAPHSPPTPPDLVPDTHSSPLMGSEVCLQDQ